MRVLARLFLLLGCMLVAAAANAVTTLSASPTSVAAGGTVTATWSGIPSPTATDWVGLYAPGAPHSPSLSWRYTTGTASGNVPFTIPASIAAGTYELRLFANNGYTLLATSSGLTVTGPVKTVSGTVTVGSSPLAGVAFAATNSGTCTASNASGQYSCTVPQGWSGSVTPSLSGHSFAPASRNYSNVTANQTAQDYAATLVTYQVSGTVTLGGTPLAGVNITATGGESCSDSNASGEYACTVPQGWTGTVTPSLSGHTFTPASRNYSNVVANQTAQDYAATVVSYQVSGTVTVGGSPLAGVVFAATNGGVCTSSNASGQYGCAVPQGWSGSVTPSLSGYSFAPPSRSHSNVVSNLTGQDFAATVSTASTTTYYIHTDHLNTPRAITNLATQVVWRWDQLEPFGVTPANDNPSGAGVFEFNLRFPGQFFDRETNTHYNMARDYDPQTSRYVQADPGGLFPDPAQENAQPALYSYALSSPVRYTDPTGYAAGIIIRTGQAAMALCMRIAACREKLVPLIKKARDLCKDIDCVFRRDPGHHPFAMMGYCEHYQFDCGIKGVRRSGFSVRIPIPGTCKPDRRTDFDDVGIP